jgi:hypothetical protein
MEPIVLYKCRASPEISLMEMHESALHDLLASVHGDGCAQALVDRVADGEPLLLKTADSTFETYRDVPSVLALLGERFGWKKAA